LKTDAVRNIILLSEEKGMCYMKSTLASAAIWIIIAIALLVGSVTGFMNGNMGGPAIMAFFGIVFVAVAWSKFKTFLAEKESAGFLEKCSEKTVEIIDRVLSVDSENDVINNRAFSQDDVRMIAMDHQRQWAMVMTGDCVYEKHANSYRGLETGLRDIKFIVGSEYKPTKRELVDVGSYARSGYAAGGLGVAAMNAADAMKMNAEGGRLTSGGIYFPVDLKSGGNTSSVKIVIIRNDLLKNFGTPYMYANKEKGRYYTAFNIILDNRATADKCAKELSKYVRTIATEEK